MTGTGAWFDTFPPEVPDPRAEWTDPTFLDELRDWVAGTTGQVATLEQVKLRPWASVWRAETASGTFFVKENCAGQAFEAGLVAELSIWVPDLVVPVTAIHHGRGRLLTADQGPTLADVASHDLDSWCHVVVEAAHLQRRVASYAGRMLDLGLTRLAPGEAADYAAARARQLAALPAPDPRRVSAAEADRVTASLSGLRRWADAELSLQLPLTLQHSDLHEHNIFARSRRFFDYADSVISTPLGVLLVPLNTLAHLLDAGPGDQRLWRVANAYLEVWSDLVSMRELRATLPAALRLARLARLESWLRVSASFADDAMAEFGGVVSAWLRCLGDDPVLT